MEETSSKLTGKRCAVVTGASRGIGSEICRQLASNGIAVILTARDEKKGTKAVQRLTLAGLSNVVFQQLDVKDPLSVARLTSFVETHYGKLDVLVIEHIQCFFNLFCSCLNLKGRKILVQDPEKCYVQKVLIVHIRVVTGFVHINFDLS